MISQERILRDPFTRQYSILQEIVLRIISVEAAKLTFCLRGYFRRIGPCISVRKGMKFPNISRIIIVHSQILQDCEPWDEIVKVLHHI